MTELLIDLQPLLDPLTSDAKILARMALTDIASKLTNHSDGRTYRIIWLDSGSGETLRPFLEVMSK